MNKCAMLKSILALTVLSSTICFSQAPAAAGATAQTAGIDPALMAKAEEGKPDAEFLVAVQYELGAKVKKDPSEAAAWYRKAAEKGYAQAQHSLGVLYEYGNGVPVDYATAISWYRKAAQRGFAPAEFSLGFCYEHGKGVPQDYKQAISWYESAAQQKNSDALMNLAYLYHNGTGVPKDEARSFDYVRQAAEAGSPDAQFQLGMAYHNGQESLPLDEDLARTWLHRSAAQGEVAAQFNYAVLLKAQPEKVYFWLSLATPHLSGSTKQISKTLRDKAAARLNPAQKTEIDRSVEAWKPVEEQP